MSSQCVVSQSGSEVCECVSRYLHRPLVDIQFMHYILAGRVSGQHQTNSRWAWIRKGATPNHMV